MNDQVIPSLSRDATIETVVPDTRVAPAAPVLTPIPVVIAPPPRVEQPARPPGDLQPEVANNPISTFALGDPVPVASTNLAPDISTYVSSNEPYFQLSSNVAPTPLPDTWYEFPTLTGSVLFDNTIPVPVPTPGQGELHALGGSIFYNANSLMPSTWYLNPALNGEVLLVDASGTQLLHSIDANLYYNNELLAKANDIQDVADWSLYPALATVELAGQNLTQVANIDASGGTIGALNATTATATGAGTFGSVSSTGAGAFGSVSSTGAGTFGSITSNGIINAASHQVQNATAVTIGPGAVGTLSSPDGTVLTWNGNSITTGTGGDASNWSNYPAITTVTGLSTAPLALQAGAGQQLTLNAPDSAITATTGGAYNVTVDKGVSILSAANVNVTAQNGSGGNIALNAQPGYQLGTQQIGYGAIQLNAYGSSNQALGLGGKIDITAYSGGLGEYGSATSRVSMSSATIALSAGAVPTIPGTAGAMNIFGQDIISIVACVAPPILPQFPQTVYIYGLGIPGVAGGVRLESPNGIQLAGNSDLYATDIYPYTSLGLNLKGRASVPGPAADVTIADCASIDMRSAATIGGVTTLTMAGVGALAGVKSITAPLASGVGTPNLVISGNPVPLLGFTNFVQIQNAGTIAFDVSGAGALTGVQTVNGVAYPPPVGDSSDWATFPAVQAVDMSGNGITNLASITTLTNANITSAGSLLIVTDGADLNLAADNGGNISMGTGNQGNISIQTAGAGHNLTLTGDGIQMTGAASLNIDGGATIVMSATTDFTAGSVSGNSNINAQLDCTLYSATGNINLVADAGGDVIIQQGVLNMDTHKITNLVAGVNPTDAVNVAQLTTVVTSKDATEFFVSDAGNDTTGNGSFFAPYATIQKAITQAELVSSNILVCVINVASGHYNENLTFNKGYIVLNGSLSSQTGNEVCEITGSISIALAGANDVFNRQVTFQGFNITHGPGQAITDTSTASHTVTLQDCKIFAYQQSFVSTATCPDMRLYMTNVEVQQTYLLSAFPVIVTNVGQAEFERLDVTCTGNATAIVIGGTSVMTRLSLATLDTTNPNTPLLPLLSITSTTTATHSIGNVAFAFTSTVAKTNTNAMYIASGINTAILMFNSLFTLAGTASSTNNCIGYNGVGSPTIAGINNTSLNVNVLLPQTTSVQSGITQIQYTNIQPPGLATYSSTADQVIAVSGTPQALTYNTTQFNQGTTLVSNSRVYATAQGNYALSYSVELQHAGAGATQIATTFLKRNGTTIANTGRQWSIASGSFQNAATAEFVVSLNAGDYVEVFFNGDTSLSANATAAAGALPAIPSVVFNIKQFR